MKGIRFFISVISLAIIAGGGYGLYKLFTFKPDLAMPQMPPPAHLRRAPSSERSIAVDPERRTPS